MNFLRAALARIAGLFTGQREDDDLREELEAHLEMETAEYVRRGMRPDDARRKARLSVGRHHRRGGSRARTARPSVGRESRRRHQVRDARAPAQPDLRVRRRDHARAGNRREHGDLQRRARSVAQAAAASRRRSSPLLPPLDRLPNGADVGFSVPEVGDIRSGTTSLAGVAEYSSWYGTLRESNAAPASISLSLVTGNFFDVMGLSPVLGRLTSPANDGRGVAPVMVLTLRVLDEALRRRSVHRRPAGESRRRPASRSSASCSPHRGSPATSTC